MKHGTRYGWFQGCRCDECEEGRLAADRARRARRKQRAATDPSTIRHGRWGYADYGCRCDVCVEEHRRQKREQTGAQPRRRWTEDEVTRAVGLYASAGARAASEAVGAKPDTVRRWARTRGVEGYKRPPTHGIGGYDRGCRCGTCVTVYREAMARYRALRFVRQHQAPHGTPTGYINWGCRCEDCRDAGSLWNARQRRRRQVREVLAREGS